MATYDNIWLEKFRQLLITRAPNYLGLIPIRPVLWLFPFRPLKFQDVNQLVQNIMVKDLICSNTYYKALAAAPLLKVRIPKTGPPERFWIKWGLVYVCLFACLSGGSYFAFGCCPRDGQGSHLQQYLLQGVGCCTANMCREITVKLQSKKCNSEKLQFFTVGHSSLYFLQVKNCNFSIIFL